MASRTLTSQSKGPLREACTNIPSDGTKLSRGWWSLKSFSKTEVPERVGRSLVDDSTKYLVLVSACKGSSLSSIIAQVYGGPLRSVHQVQEYPYPIVLLEFVNSVHASLYKLFVDSRKCIVNGNPVFQFTPTEQHCSMVSPRIPMEKVPQLSRRTLEIFRPVSLKFNRPQVIQCEVSPVQIMKAFSAVGPVLEVRPMLYQKYIAFAIDYTDIESAKTAKELFDRECERGIPKLFVGLHYWSLEYSRDYTERNCF